MNFALALALVLQTAADEPVATAPPEPPSSVSETMSAPTSAEPPAAAAPPATTVPIPWILPVAPPLDPRRIDDFSRPLLGAVPQGSYEADLRSAFARNQNLQGPLDGPWLLRDAAGAVLYRLQLVDRGLGGPPLEGAWSDLHAQGPRASGFLIGAFRDGARLTVQFAPPGGGLLEAVLDPRPEGGFAGEMKAGPDAAPRPVTLGRP